MKLITILFLNLFILVGISSAQFHQSKNDQLYMAIQMQDSWEVLKNIVAGADVNYVDSGRPILSWAAQNENAFVVQSLIKAGANPNVADDYGETPLMRAIESGHIKNVRVLLKAKADPNAKDMQGESSFFKAVKSRKPEIVKALIKAGADVNAVTPDGDTAALIAAQDGMPESYEIIKILGEAKANMNVSNLIYTPLSYAVDQGNKELVQALLSAGADANAKTNYGTLPIQRALEKPEILELLIKAKADPNVTFENGTTPLIQAIEYGYTDSVKLLLEAGANPQQSTSYGTSAIELAEQYSRADIVELLKAKLPSEAKPSEEAAAAVYAVDPEFSNCTMADAAKMQMELHGLLQNQVTAGKMDSEIFRTFNDDTKDYADMLTRNPGEACTLFKRLRAKYGV